MFNQRNTAAKKLTSELVEELRTRYEGGETQGKLSRDFGISVGQVGRIVRGESWQGSMSLRAGRPPTARRLTEEELEAIAFKVMNPTSPVEAIVDAPRSPEAQERAKAFGAFEDV